MATDFIFSASLLACSSSKFSRDTTKPSKGSRINYKHSTHRQNGRFGYYFKDEVSGFDKSKTYYEYCYTGNTNPGCGATCSNGNTWSHKPATLKSSDNRSYQDGQFDFVSGNSDGSNQVKMEGGIQTACLGNYIIRAYYKVCDRAGNSYTTDLETLEW